MTPEQAAAELARRKFDRFMPYTFGPKYQHTWFSKTLCRALQRIADGEIDRLIIDLPPRHGKTEHVSRYFPAWYMGRHPDAHLIGAGYADSLARKNSRDIWRILGKPAYKTLFPTFDLGHKKAQEEWETNGGGSYRAGGVGSGFTGRPGNGVLIDDPLKSREQANSPAFRERLWGWFNDDIVTRLEDPGWVIVMATRWHHDDLTGRILESEPELWEHIHIPALYEGDSHPDDPRQWGEALWPYRVTAEELNKRRKRSPASFESLYQGNPTPPSGNLFAIDKIREYKSAADPLAAVCDWITISVDATFGKKGARNDYAAIVTLGGRGEDVFVLDIVHERLGFRELKRALALVRERFPRAVILIEDRANGSALIEDMRVELGRVLAFEPGNNSKEARASLLADTIESGHFYVPHAAFADWAPKLLAELSSFPSGKHDDMTDATAQAILHRATKKSPLEHLRRIVGAGSVRDAAIRMFS
jgi:predicted phage terminase large subunit-like protein